MIRIGIVTGNDRKRNAAKNGSFSGSRVGNRIRHTVSRKQSYPISSGKPSDGAGPEAVPCRHTANPRKISTPRRQKRCISEEKVICRVMAGIIPICLRNMTLNGSKSYSI